MSEYDDDDYNGYNGDPVHDMELDYDYHMNTGELPEYFEDSDFDFLFDDPD